MTTTTLTQINIFKNLETSCWCPLNDHMHTASQAARCREGSISMSKEQVSREAKETLALTDKADISGLVRKGLQPIDIPPLFSRAIGITRNRKKPKQIPESRWINIIQRLNILVEEERHHLLKMVGYGWPMAEIFGCHKFAPDTRADSMGLLMLMTRSIIVEIRPRKALLRLQGGNMAFYALGAINRNPCECSTLMEVE
jgi:hypothetical protein